MRDWEGENFLVSPLLNPKVLFGSLFIPNTVYTLNASVSDRKLMVHLHIEVYVETCFFASLKWTLVQNPSENARHKENFCE